MSTLWLTCLQNEKGWWILLVWTGIANVLRLDTWKRDQGLLMLDKRRSALVETYLFFEGGEKGWGSSRRSLPRDEGEFTWQATFAHTVKQTRNYQLLFQLEKKSRWSQCIFSGGSTGTCPGQGEHRAQKATSDVGRQVSPLFLSAFKSFVSR